MWPKGKTAFVVIHGTGAHEPFQTLDSFVRGFWNVLKKHYLNVQWKHNIQRRKDWVESYISLKHKNKPSIDFYEYYWDCYMVHKTNVEDVINFLETASSNAAEFYISDPKVAEKYAESGLIFFKHGKFIRSGYLFLLG